MWTRGPKGLTCRCFFSFEELSFRGAFFLLICAIPVIIPDDVSASGMNFFARLKGTHFRLWKMYRVRLALRGVITMLGSIWGAMGLFQSLFQGLEDGFGILV